VRPVVIAGTASGIGKTTVALGLMAALRRRGLRVQPFKVGPDYIDPGFHTAASGVPCVNLDPWAMRRETIAALAAALESGAELVLCEGAMGLFDGGGKESRGSTADLAALTGWPVVLVLDVAGQSGSAAAVLRGFLHHRADVPIAGVIFNRVGGPRHKAVLETTVRAAAASSSRGTS